MEDQIHSCIDCGVVNCNTGTGAYPNFCLTTELCEETLKDMVELYKNDDLVHRVAIASAEVEGAFYCKMTRAEEIMEFARRIGAKKIGIATCVGLISESRTYARILRHNGFEVYGAACKVGSIEKAEIGVEEQYLLNKGNRMCNPVLQAQLLNQHKTDLNVVIGLCVGHDSLFNKYSDALVTTLVTKDRVMGHNPVNALYTANTYSRKRLFPEQD